MGNNRISTEASVARIHFRPPFKVNQVWRTRGGDEWTIEAITSHPRSPVIARSPCDSIRCFGLDGIFDGEDEEGPLDLVTVVKDTP